jgi:hypothetical protein
MKFDRNLLRRAFGVAIAARLLLSGCAGGEPGEAEPGAYPATIGAAGEGAGNGSAGGPSEDEPPADEGGGASRAPSFGEVYAILAATCGGGRSGCHITGMAAGLTLPDAEIAYEHLVGADSMKCAGERLVEPGDADASVLIAALEGSSTCVKMMPIGREPLVDEQLATIRAWIDAGARPD